MKTIIHSFLIALLMTFGSCVTSVRFPVSQIAPAEDDGVLTFPEN